MNNTKLIVFLFVALSTFSCKKFKQQKLFSKEDEMLEIKEEEPIVEAEEEDTVEIEIIEQETEPVEIEEEPPVEPLIGYSSDRYYMVVGSFLNEGLAHKYANKLVDQGYNPQVIHSVSTGFYRVSAKSYNDFKVATGEIEEFRNTVTPRAWVHVKK